MTKASRDTQTRRRERKGRRKEREGKERKRTGVASSNKRPGTHQGERGEPEYYIQELTKKERKGKEGVLSYDTSVQGHTKRKEGFPAMTKASRDTQTRRRERKGRRKEREGKERKRTGVASSNKRPGTHQGERGEPEYYIQELTKKERKGKEGVLSYDTSVQGHTKRKEGFAAMTKASRDTQTRRRERKGRRKERGKREEEDRCSQLRTSVQGHTRVKGVNLSITFRNTPKKRGKEKKVFSATTQASKDTPRGKKGSQL